MRESWDQSLRPYETVYSVPSPEVRIADLESEVRALRYALGSARVQIEMLKEAQDD